MKRLLLPYLIVAAVVAFGPAGCLTITAPQCGTAPVSSGTRTAVSPTATRTGAPSAQATTRPVAGSANQSGAQTTSLPQSKGTPAPAPTVTGGAPPSTAGVRSPHPAGWLNLHGAEVKVAGGVDKATIAGGISCATCHTTAMSPDGSVAHSPVATYTCFSCHNGPNG